MGTCCMQYGEIKNELIEKVLFAKYIFFFFKIKNANNVIKLHKNTKQTYDHIITKYAIQMYSEH